MTVKRVRTRRRRDKGESPRPWKTGLDKFGELCIFDADGNEVVWHVNSTCNSIDRNEANAKLIVAAVNSYKAPAEKTGKYGVKAYGSVKRFGTKDEFMDYLLEWIAGTDGSERERAMLALANLQAGIPFTDTDQPEKA